MNNLYKYIASFMLILGLLIGCSNTDDEQDDEEEQLIGNWSGAIEVPSEPIHIQISFQEEDERESFLTIPAQGISDLPFETVDISTPEINLMTDLGGQPISFEGEYDEEKLAGTYHQAGQTFPFELTKTSDGQEDEGEFLSIESGEDTLYGELEQPDEEEPHPIVIIIPGSGPTDRNGNTIAGENNGLKFLAEQLADQGIASLRFDKRGAGKNSEAIGDIADFSFEQYIDDAVQWVELLQADERFSEFGIIGHSEGSLVGMLAAQEIDLDVFVSLAGAGRSADELLYEQFGEQLSDGLLAESKDLLEQIKAGETVEDVPNELMDILSPAQHPFLTSWMQYDPAEEMEQLSIPTLIVNGENDLQVPASDAEQLDEAAQNAELLIIEKMNHILKESPADREENLLTYSDPTLPLADGLIEEILSFFKENQFEE